MGVLKGVPKNQVTKQTFTAVVYLNLAGEEYEILRRRIQADDVREAVAKLNKTVNG